MNIETKRSDKAGKATSYRLGFHCLQQILKLSIAMKLTQSEVIRLAVDRMAREELQTKGG